MSGGTAVDALTSVLDAYNIVEGQTMNHLRAAELMIRGAVTRRECWDEDFPSTEFRAGTFRSVGHKATDKLTQGDDYIVDVVDSWNRFRPKGHKAGKVKLCRCGEELTRWLPVPGQWKCLSKGCGAHYDGEGKPLRIMNIPTVRIPLDEPDMEMRVRVLEMLHAGIDYNERWHTGPQETGGAVRFFPRCNEVQSPIEVPTVLEDTGPSSEVALPEWAEEGAVVCEIQFGGCGCPADGYRYFVTPEEDLVILASTGHFDAHGYDLLSWGHKHRETGEIKWGPTYMAFWDYLGRGLFEHPGERRTHTVAVQVLLVKRAKGEQEHGKD